jgi:hypothetical protein
MIFTLTTTKLGLPCVEMHNAGAAPSDKPVAKMYPSQDGTKLRIVIPTLKSFKQARIDIDSGYIEVNL